VRHSPRVSHDVNVHVNVTLTSFMTRADKQHVGSLVRGGEFQRAELPDLWLHVLRTKVSLSVMNMF